MFTSLKEHEQISNLNPKYEIFGNISLKYLIERTRSCNSPTKNLNEDCKYVPSYLFQYHF